VLGVLEAGNDGVLLYEVVHIVVDLFDLTLGLGGDRSALDGFDEPSRRYSRGTDRLSTLQTRVCRVILRRSSIPVPRAARRSRKGNGEAGENMAEDSLEGINQRLLTFARERDWERFHSPKNLVMALAGECGELLEHFQWLSEEQSASLATEKRREVAFEMADILIYLIRLAERLDLDLLAAAAEKVAINEQRYPVHKVRGDARRAGEYED